MAETVKIALAKIPLNGAAVIPAFTPLASGTAGACVDFTQSDYKTVVLIKNAHATDSKSVTFLKGDGIQGVTDLTASIPAGETQAFCLESGKFKHTSGVYKGNVFLTGTSPDIQVAALLLP